MINKIHSNGENPYYKFSNENSKQNNKPNIWQVYNDAAENNTSKNLTQNQATAKQQNLVSKISQLLKINSASDVAPNLPTNDPNPPTNRVYTLEEQKQMNADGEHYVFDKNGHITQELNENGHITKDISYNDDGSIAGYQTYKYNNNNCITESIIRNADGSIIESLTVEFNENGTRTEYFSLYRDDGSMLSCTTNEYGENGKEINSDTHFY